MIRIKLSNRFKSVNGSSNITMISKDNDPKLLVRKMDRDNLKCQVKGYGLILKIMVIKARNLAAKDKNGLSDPYLTFTLGDSRHSTYSIAKTLNPSWNVLIQMPISDTNSMVLNCVCWDKDRFKKDYMGEFDLAIDDIFSTNKTELEPKWFPLQNGRALGKKGGTVSGDVQLQLTLFDSTGLSAAPELVLEKLRALTSSAYSSDDNPSSKTPSIGDIQASENIEEPSDESDRPEPSEKRRRNIKLKGLRKKKSMTGYEFSSGGEVVGIVFLEIHKIIDLPPEKNVTRTSFDMDPFLIASLGKKTQRTRVIRHNLNPVFDEKMIFQVLKHEQTYSFSFTVIDRDKLSGNDFVASTLLPLKALIDRAPEADPKTGLYALNMPEAINSQPNKSRFKLSINRSLSMQELGKISRPRNSNQSFCQPNRSFTAIATSQTQGSAVTPEGQQLSDNIPSLTLEEGYSDSNFHHFTIPLKLKNAEKWDEKHNPQLFINAKYVPYSALRQQFWRSMLRQYDSDESNRISKVELTTMLDTLGSTLKESTIDSWFSRFSNSSNCDETSPELSFDEAVICLEDQILKNPNSATDNNYRNLSTSSSVPHGQVNAYRRTSDLTNSTITEFSDNENNPGHVKSSINEDIKTQTEEGNFLDKDDLNDRGEEHVIEIRECPICHQPRLNKRSDADIVTHIATCASQDWRQVNNIVMGGFVTSSQAQRKWYSKVITKIYYGGYKLGANSANILVQDRITGEIIEERMSVYVRLGIRLLYKGLKSKEMEKKRIRKLLRSLSQKQGVKYDDPTSRAEIPKFISFHQLDMSEVLSPIDSFPNFNEFFFRKLKPGSRPCSAPENPGIVVSPADCRSVVFNRIGDATQIWVKGREFTVERLLGNAYPQYAKNYKNGALGIFRLAPQDYHRFHVPVDGVLEKPKTIEGEYYTVNPMAIRSALDVYGENVRVVIPINSVAHGRVIVICVGAMMVGSTVIVRKEGEHVKRAEELGYFKFGGSTILLLFEEGMMQFDEDLVANSITALETLVRTFLPELSLKFCVANKNNLRLFLSDTCWHARWPYSFSKTNFIRYTIKLS
ncbi:Phosphatidylserine decarboxylase proenzyme 3 [Erysiphe necator]|nr:Phosphatidylserine decarboxylase proenzyme 3 [Erysiphe necator]